MFSCPTVSAGALVSEGLRMLASPEALVITNGRTVPSPRPVPAVCVSFFFLHIVKDVKPPAKARSSEKFENVQ